MGAQLELVGRGDTAEDGFRFTWWNTREGASVFVEHRGWWRPGVVVHLGRRYVSVMLTERSGRTVYVRRAYGELRRRVVKPKLSVVAKA
jgi:hypothetical protein